MLRLKYFFWHPIDRQKHLLPGDSIHDYHDRPAPAEVTALCGKHLFLADIVESNEMEWMKAATCVPCYNAGKASDIRVGGVPA